MPNIELKHLYQYGAKRDPDWSSTLAYHHPFVDEGESLAVLMSRSC